MTESLEDVKERLSRRYLGAGPIHGLGIRRAERAVYVYVDPECDVEGEAVLEEVRKAAAPFKVVVVKGGRPKATGEAP